MPFHMSLQLKGTKRPVSATTHMHCKRCRKRCKQSPRQKILICHSFLPSKKTAEAIENFNPADEIMSGLRDGDALLIR